MTNADSAEDMMKPPASGRVLWCLRIVILIQCIGLAGKYFLSPYESESDVYGFLFFDHGWSENVAQHIDDGGAIASLVAGMLILLVGLLSKPGRVHLFVTIVSLLTVFVWFFTISITHMLRGEPFASLSLGEHAVRYVVPFALAIMLIRWSPTHSPACGRVGLSGPERDLPGRGHRPEAVVCVQPSRNRLAMTMLVLASSATFLVHGYKAFVRYGPFTDLILLSDTNLFGLEPSQSAAESALAVIGIIDILVAVLLIATRWRAVAIYMAVWGLVTSLSRMTALGLVAWPETLIRAANWGAPLAVLLYDGWWKKTVSKQDN